MKAEEYTVTWFEKRIKELNEKFYSIKMDDYDGRRRLQEQMNKLNDALNKLLERENSNNRAQTPKT